MFFSCHISHSFGVQSFVAGHFYGVCIKFAGFIFNLHTLFYTLLECGLTSKSRLFCRPGVTFLLSKMTCLSYGVLPEATFRAAPSAQQIYEGSHGQPLTNLLRSGATLLLTPAVGRHSSSRPSARRCCRSPRRTCPRRGVATPRALPRFARLRSSLSLLATCPRLAARASGSLRSPHSSNLKNITTL